MLLARVKPLQWRLPALCAVLLVTMACSHPTTTTMSSKGIDPVRTEQAIKEAQVKRAKGQRVWCVPFARTASGIEIRGNAKTWWQKAQGSYAQGHDPQVGAVMAFRSTRKMPMGHVAVVSDVVNEREIRVDHANWKRNQVSLKMAVIDVSPKNDWSEVRLESQADSFGSVYPINGFIYPVALR